MTESILNIASRHAKQHDAVRVTDIHIIIGRLSSIVDESVQFYWDIISEGTLCAGARLHFERIPAELACQDCGNQFEIERDLVPCPACGSMRLKVTRGEEFWLDSIEIERGEAPAPGE